MSEHKVLMACCGKTSSCALTNIGEVFSWGRLISEKDFFKKQNF